MSSLKLKKNVLLLEAPLEVAPALDLSKRWIVGESWVWLAPRSSRVLLEAPLQIRDSYQDFKNLLSTSK
jgi:hypothetical protein